MLYVEYNFFMTESEKRSMCFELMTKAVEAVPGRKYSIKDLKDGAKIIYEFIFGKDIKD
jgi:hypothetical protein